MIVNKETSLEMYIDKWRFLGEKPCRARAVRVAGWVGFVDACFDWRRFRFYYTPAGGLFAITPQYTPIVEQDRIDHFFFFLFFFSKHELLLGG